MHMKVKRERHRSWSLFLPPHHQPLEEEPPSLSFTKRDARSNSYRGAERIPSTESVCPDNADDNTKEEGKASMESLCGAKIECSGHNARAEQLSGVIGTRLKCGSNLKFKLITFGLKFLSDMDLDVLLLVRGWKCVSVWKAFVRCLEQTLVYDSYSNKVGVGLINLIRPF